MSDLQHLLERFAETGEQRGAETVFDMAVNTVARRRKRRRFGAALSAVVAVTMVLGAIVIVRAHNDKSLRVVTTPTSISTTSIPAPVSASLLMSGHWGSLPLAPIVPRDSPSIAWTGKEMLVWGGFSTDAKQTPYANGAAYDPRSRAWRRLPAAPLAARLYPASAWTGTELVIWGGYTSSSGSASANDGAAYNPVTNRWRKLAPSPLRPQANALAVWSGSRVVILSDSSTSAAAYDPETDRWQVLTPPKLASGATPAWRGAVRIDDHRLLLWAHADTTTPAGANSVTIRGATTMFLSNEATNEWRTIPTASNAVPDIREAFWTGTEVIVRGDMRDCEICQGPGPLPELSASYRPATNTWSLLPSEPLEAGVIGGGGRDSVWTGAALWSFEPFDPRSNSDSRNGLAPGQSTVYDAASGHWTRIKPAPFACANSVDPVWTGHEVLIYCPSRSAGGLTYIAAR